MAITLYSATVPVFQRMLRNLSHVLDKGEAFAEARKFDPANLTQYRLAPDMLPFTSQVLIACDAAKLGVARVAGIDAPKFEDTEKTFAELRERVKKTLDFLETVKPEHLDGRESQEVTFPQGKEMRTMKGEDYLMLRTLPNFFFHVTMAYAILRHNGVELGKRDYLAGASA